MMVQHEGSETRGRFFVEHEGEIAAEMTYSITGGNRMLIEHTEVDEVLRGQNIGYELVHAGVEYARLHGMTIIPVCSFAKAVFDKKPDFADVVEKA